MKQIKTLFILFIFTVAPLASWADCTELFTSSEQGVIPMQAEFSENETYVVNVQHHRINEIIDQVLTLQKTLLINHKPRHEITSSDTEKGFLIGEKDSETVRHFLTEDGGEILGVCRKLGSETRLAGYVFLGPISEFLDAYRDPREGTLTFSMDQTEWERFVTTRNPRYIEQIAVHPDLRRSGVGQELISAAKKLYPNGLVADILFGPEPFNNAASYRFFKEKEGFTDIGDLHVRKLSKYFGECWTHAVMWNPDNGRSQPLSKL